MTIRFFLMHSLAIITNTLERENTMGSSTPNRRTLTDVFVGVELVTVI